MKDAKVNILLEGIWVGKKTYECDGSLDDFSQMTYLLTSNLMKVPRRTISPFQFFNNNYSVSIE